MLQTDIINEDVQQQPYTKPHYIFFIVFASGISQGFVSVTLPYLLSQNGFSVGTISQIVGLGVSANLIRFLWGPFVDLSLSLRKWFWISTVLCIGTLMLLCITPYTIKGTLLLYIIVFLSQVAATFLLLPVSGFMAKRIETSKKGSAGGWFQAGSLGGTGLGGGVGLWLATHYNVVIAGIVLCAISLLFSLVVMKIKDVPHAKGKTIGEELSVMGNDIISLITTPVILFIMFMICLPIGTGAVSNLLSAIAVDWKTGADTVALVTGILFGLISAVGCVAGGFIADRWGNWKSYLGFGIFYALITGGMALFPYTPLVYVTGVIIYAFSIGMMNAAFTSVLLFATGKKNAATKFSILVSLGNVSFFYMTYVDGVVHDKHSSKYMLLNEAALCLLSVFICVIILNWMKARKMIVKTID